LNRRRLFDEELERLRGLEAERERERLANLERDKMKLDEKTLLARENLAGQHG